MKFFACIFISLALIQPLFSQQNTETKDFADFPYWIEMMKDKTSNFNETQKAFYEYRQKHEVKRGNGYKAFKRWEWFTKQRVDEFGNTMSADKIASEKNKYFKIHKSLHGNWHELGPFEVPEVTINGLNGLGRVNTIEFHPTQPNILFAGTPSGGLWKSTNSGSTWTCLTSDIPTLGVSTIAICASNPEIIFIGTGDRDAADSPGLGVMKSSNGGISWEFKNSGMGECTVNKLLINPNDSSLLIAATDNGIYRSTDFGETWILQIGENNDVTDMAYKPGDPNIVYAIKSGIFFRSNDAGITWNYILSGISSSYRKVIGVTPANPEVVYVLASNTYDFNAFYKSENSGLNFTKICDSPNILGYDENGGDTAGQSWYDLCIAVDPNDETTVFAGGINIWVTHTSGLSWSFLVGDDIQQTNFIHVDQHYLAYSPLNGKLYACNDGGIYTSDSDGYDWSNLSSGLAIAQVYKIGQSQLSKNYVLCGNQDNGTTYFKNSEWFTTLGADGMECIVSPNSNNTMFMSMYYGSIYRSTDGGDHNAKVAGESFQNIDESGDWVTPYILDISDPNTMFVGYKNIWRTNNINSNNNQNIDWVKISDNLAGTNTNNMVCLEQSVVNPDILYAAREDKKMFRCDNVNASAPTWTTLPTLPANVAPTDIVTSPSDENIVYITLNHKVYKSVNKGVSWINISGSLPDVPVSSITYYKSCNECLYIGTDLGVFFYDVSIFDWIPFNQGLPFAAEVTEVEIFYDSNNTSENVIRASTYGRGLWESDLYSPENTPPIADFSSSTNNPLVNEIVSFTDNSQFSPTSWEWNFYPNTISFSNGTDKFSQNPEVAFLTEQPYAVSLTVSNQFGTDTKIINNYITFINNASDLHQVTSILISPNPSSGIFSVDITGLNCKEIEYSVLSSNGNEKLKGKLKVINGKVHNSFDLSNCSAGNYFLNINVDKKQIANLTLTKQ